MHRNGARNQKAVCLLPALHFFSLLGQVLKQASFQQNQVHSTRFYVHQVAFSSLLLVLGGLGSANSMPFPFPRTYGSTAIA